MATTTPGSHIGPVGAESRFLTELSRSASPAAMAGAAAVLLSIIGLAGVEPLYVAAVSVIAIGAALLIGGAASMSQQSESVAGAGRRERVEGGLNSEVLGGVAGIVLGILALLQIFPIVLLSAAAVIFGASLLLGAGLNLRIRTFEMQPTAGQPAPGHVRREAILGGTGAQALVAIAAIVLGILALVHIESQILTLVAMLVLGASILLSGSATTTRILTSIVRG
jgi:hypothetical protein